MKLHVEQLEARDCPAACSLDAAGVLHIAGTAQADTVAVRQAGSVVTVDDGRARRVRRVGGEALDVRLGNGNDTFVSGLAVPTVVAGGNGNDVVFAGFGAATEYCGSGSTALLYRPNSPHTVAGYNLAKYAEFTMVDGGRAWTESNVEGIAAGVRVVLDATGNVSLLKTPTGTGTRRSSGPSIRQLFSDNDLNGTVRFMDDSFRAGINTASLVVHELAHDWISGEYSAAWLATAGWTPNAAAAAWYAWPAAGVSLPLPRNDPRPFAVPAGDSLSGDGLWFYKSTASFGPNPYAHQNPDEDLGMSMDEYIVGKGVGLPPAKVAVIASFLAAHSR